MLPEIVFLHGMAGGHLERDGRRVWLSAPTLLKGSVAEELQGALNPAGHIKLFHRPAAFYWRRRGFRVREFAYDWRLSLDEAAARLHDFIGGLSAPHLVIAAHSMGGCVAARYAALYPDEAAARIQHAWFFGVPLAGTFAAVEVLLGRFLLPRLVAGAAPFRRQQVLDGLARAAAGFAGLIDLLPDPRLFPTASLLYERRHWPEPCAPSQELLDRSRALKPALQASPILDRTTVLAASNWRTPDAVELRDGLLEFKGASGGPGDGVALLASAALPGLPVQRLHLPHAFLLFEPAGLADVAAAGAAASAE